MRATERPPAYYRFAPWASVLGLGVAIALAATLSVISTSHPRLLVAPVVPSTVVTRHGSSAASTPAAPSLGQVTALVVPILTYPVAHPAHESVGAMIDWVKSDLTVAAARARLVAVPTASAPPSGQFARTNSDYRLIALVDPASRSVRIMTTVNGRYLPALPTGAQPVAAVFAPHQPLLFVLNYGSNSLSVISTTLNEVIGDLPTGPHPTSLSVAGANVLDVHNADGSTMRVNLTNLSESTLSAPRLAAPRLPVSAVTPVPIRGDALLNATQIAAWYRANGLHERYLPILEFARIFIEEGQRAGVRGDIAFAQAIHESAALSVTDGTNNFAGLGACGSCGHGYDYASVRDGVRAQVELLRGYADPNFTTAAAARTAKVVTYHGLNTLSVRGHELTWDQLSGVWAPGSTYGESVLSIYLSMLRFARAHPTLGATPPVELPEHLAPAHVAASGRVVLDPGAVAAPPSAGPRGARRQWRTPAPRP